MIRYVFDVTAFDDPLGAVLVRLTPANGLRLAYRRPYLGFGMKDGYIQVHTDHADATAVNFAKHNLVTVRGIRDDDSEFWAGEWLMEEGDFAALSTKGKAGRLLTFTGPNSLYILQRGRLLDNWYAPSPPASDLRGSIQVPGQWTWIDISPGGWLTRGIEEGQNQPGTPLEFVSIDFDRDVDSDGIPWAQVDDEVRFPVGQTSILDLAIAAIKMGVIVQPAEGLNFRAFQTFGTDRTGLAFASDVVRFTPANVVNEITRDIRASVERSHVLVEGLDSTYQEVAGGSAAVGYWDYKRVESDTAATLTAAGERDLLARELESDAAFPVRHRVRSAPLSGFYVPFDDYIPGDLATIHTGTGAHDFNERPIEVAATRIHHTAAGRWLADDELGSQYISAESRAWEERANSIIRQAGAHSHPEMLCRASQAGSATVIGAGYMSNNVVAIPSYPGGRSDTLLVVAQYGPTASLPFGAGTYAGNAMTLIPGAVRSQPGGWAVQYSYYLDPEQHPHDSFHVMGAGASYRSAWILEDAFQGAPTDIGTAIGTSAAPAVSCAGQGMPLATFITDSVGAAGDPTADPPAVQDWALNVIPIESGGSHGDTTASFTMVASKSWAAVNVAIADASGATSGDGPMPVGANGEADHGLSVRATRCDHVHPHSDLSDHPAETHHHASSSEVTPFGTIAATNVQAALEEIVSEATGAPTTADYLVGTAQAGLSAEIVVGATPGGELGGTWASPTVDATHSGSTHSDYMTVISGGGGTLHTHGNTGATETIDLALGNAHDLTLDAATVTLTLTGPAAGALREALLLLRQDGAGNRTVAWPASVAWPTAAPTLSTVGGDVDIVRLITLDGGTNWFGYHYGNYTPAAAATRYWPMLALTSD